MHRCVHCGKFYPNAAAELLSGCSCGSKFFFYIKDEKFEKLKESVPFVELQSSEKKRIESDVREMIGITEEEPVILDLESVKILKPGKFEIDLVNLFNNNRPIIYKLEEGKYIIDLASSLQVSQKDIDRKIRNPEEK